MASRKSAISVRVGETDLRNLRAIAKRLGVRGSDVFRYAVKSSLDQLGPIADPAVQGRHLLPVFIEVGPALLRFFEIDAVRLIEIINEGVADPGVLVAPEDLTLLSMADVRQQYAFVKLRELLDESPSQAISIPPEKKPEKKEDLADALREYLYEKYLRTGRRAAVG